MSGKSALIFGATGAVGKNLLRELLLSSQFTRVGEFGRRVTPVEQLEGLPRDKLLQKTIDYEKLDSAGLQDERWDTVYITLGTTRKKAGSAEQFLKIDQEYVLNAARAAKNPQQKQHIIYCSSIGANHTSSTLYARSKGETERGLASLGYADTTIFRPGLLANADRGSESRPVESVANFLSGALSYLTDSLSVPVKTLAKSMCRVGELGSNANLPAEAHTYKAGGTDGVPEFHVIGNKGCLKLAGTPVPDGTK